MAEVHRAYHVHRDILRVNENYRFGERVVPFPKPIIVPETGIKCRATGILTVWPGGPVIEVQIDVSQFNVAEVVDVVVQLETLHTG